MASIDTGGGGEKKKKGQQKKQTLRVDFTPMVDMNMLLITFFMFCTTLSKPQTMEINMPSKDKVTEGQETEFKESNAVTVLLGGDDRVYYYTGMPTNEKYEDPNFLVETNFGPDGLRSFLLSRNANVNRQIEELKVRKLNKEITDDEFKAQSIEIKKNERDNSPQVLIKAAENSNYRNLIDALDEMQICNIGVYAIVDIADGDKYLMFQKTGDPTYAVDLAQPGAQQ
jgi:Biopolymer transport protein